MNKKMIIYSLLTLLILLGIGAGVQYFANSKQISFQLSNGVSGAIVYNDKKVEVAKIDNNKTVRLQKGDYTITPSGKNISVAEIKLSVDKDATFNINPDYSTAYLLSQVDSAQKEVSDLLKNKFSFMDEYDIQKGELFVKGDWFGGLLVNKSSTYANMQDLYRFVAHKNSGVWEIINYPDLLLSKSEYPSSPDKVLDAVNDLEAEYYYTASNLVE